ncbi:MAG: hypothetical protein EOP11_05975 [Proteobacteria bacterium]|nr:MAG: hypothetical protein EOP11_05975 [Pseudomonadota bacterium]
MKSFSFFASFLLALCLTTLPARAAGDSFSVKSVAGGTAMLSGDTAGLKAGDTLYYARSPFKFNVTDVKAGQVTIALPASHDLKVDSVLLRSSNQSIQKNMDTEAKLKRALED